MSRSVKFCALVFVLVFMLVSEAEFAAAVLDDCNGVGFTCTSQCSMEYRRGELGAGGCSSDEYCCDHVCDECGLYPDCSSKITYYKDADGDGKGNLANSQKSCSSPGSTWVLNSDDCDDSDRYTYKNAWEVCDNKDNDCDGSKDESCKMIDDGINYATDSNIKYYGSWNVINTNFKSTNIKDNVVTFKFQGDKIKIYSIKDMEAGKIDICIDSICHEKDNFGQPDPYIFYTFSDLTNSEHAVVIRNKENKKFVLTSIEVFSSGVTSAMCGNGMIESEEECDDSDSTSGDGCSSICEVEAGYACSGAPSICIPSGPACIDTCPSNGYFMCDANFQRLECKDTNNDGCIEYVSNPCGAGKECNPLSDGVVECRNICGNARLDAGEVCDSNTAAIACTTNDNYNGDKECRSDCLGYGTCAANEFCGDGTKNGNEQCDDMNSDDFDACSNLCKSNYCGDMVANNGEACDSSSRSCSLGGAPGLQSCRQDCTGYEECMLNQNCGNGRVEGNEKCDDKNKAGGDGCSPDCLIESGWGCDPTGCKRLTCEIDGKCGNYPNCYDKLTFFVDLDGDGYGDKSQTSQQCSAITGYVNNNLDCDDENRFNYPGNKEICDGIDNNCDGSIDNEISLPLCSAKDAAFPAFGVCSQIIAQCRQGRLVCEHPKDYVKEETASNCDGLDNDCDGKIDEECSCNQGEKKSCGTDAGECSKGTQVCNQDGRWGDCIGENRPKAEICDSKDNDCDGEIDEDSKAACIKDNCNGYRECVGGVLRDCFSECTDSINLKMDLDDYAVLNMMDELGLEGESKQMARKALLSSEQQTESKYETGKTIIKSTLFANEQLNDVNYTLYIPKCLSPYIGQIKFENENFTIIKDDPVIAWHFVDVKDRVDLNYEIEGRIPEICLEKIKGLPVAKYLGKPKSGFNLRSLIIPFIIIALAIAVAMLPKHVIHKERTELEMEQDFIEKQRERYAKQIKSMKFGSREQAEHYLAGLGMSNEDAAIILDRVFK